MLPLIINPNNFRIDDFIHKLAKQYDIPDCNIFRIKPLKEEITINQIRELKKDLLISQTQKRMIVFFEFEKSGLETQNSLLKILEEKVDQNLFIFLVRNPEKIISTIKSRAKIIHSPIKKQEKVDPLIKEVIERLKEAKNPGFLNNKDLTITKKEKFLELAGRLTVCFKKELRKDYQDKLTVIKILKKILQTTYFVESNNLNPQLAFDNLLIFIWKNLNIELQGSKAT